MFRYTVTGDEYGIMKLSRITSNYTGSEEYIKHYHGPGDLMEQYQPHEGWAYGNCNTGTQSLQYDLAGITSNAWQRIEMYKKLSTAGQADGKIFWSRNNTVGYQNDALMTRESGFTFQENSFLLGLMFANVRNDGNFHFYIDDVYVSNTQARVEIGNASSFTSCTHREIQIPSAWASGSIAVTVNAGTFGSGTAYLYVVDANGSVNASGYAVTIGGGCTAPSITTQPQSQTKAVGTSVTFSVVASGTAPLSYQWKKNTVNISGATSSSYTIASVQTGDAATYTCYVSNSCGNVTSSGAVLTVSSDIIIDNGGTGTSQSGSWSSSTYYSGYYGSNYMYAPDATGHWYQWVGTLTAGTYQVYAWWQAVAGRPTDVVFNITHSSGTANVTKNQSTGGSTWNLLGTYTFGTTGTVRLNSSANGTEGACADAVKFVRVTTNYTITASAGTGGTITPSGAVVVAQGANQSFTIAKNTGYVISQVAVDGVNQGAITSYTFTNVQANHTIAATFVRSTQAYYNFNAGSGTTLADLSGYANNGTITGATWSTSGKYSNCLVFNGTTNYVSVPDANSLDLTNAMTLEAWVYPTATLANWQTVIAKETTGNIVYSLYANGQNPAANRPTAIIQTNVGRYYVQGTAIVAPNVWTHLATVYDGSTLKMYVNGTQVGSVAASGSINVSAMPLKLGSNAAWGEWYKGRMDDVYIYNRALTSTEINTDKNTTGLKSALLNPGMPTGTSDFTNPEENLKVFFSPAGLQVSYISDLAGNEKAMVTVYDIRGRLIQQYPSDTETLRSGIILNKAQWPAGLYFVRVTTVKANLSKSVMK